MTFKLYICKKMNSRGNVEISLRFRHGKIDQQSCTNLWIKPIFVVRESFADDGGNESSDYVLKLPDDGVRPGDVADYRVTVACEVKGLHRGQFLHDASPDGRGRMACGNH